MSVTVCIVGTFAKIVGYDDVRLITGSHFQALLAHATGSSESSHVIFLDCWDLLQGTADVLKLHTIVLASKLDELPQLVWCDG